MFSFSFVSRYFFTSSMISSVICWLLYSIFLAPSFLQFFCSWFLTHSVTVGKDAWCDFNFLISAGLLCGPACALSWRMFQVHLKRMCVLLPLDGMLYKYQLSPSGLTCHLILCFLTDFLSGWSVICLCEVFQVPTVIMLLSISLYMAVNICLIYWGAPMLGACIFTAVISSF